MDNTTLEKLNYNDLKEKVKSYCKSTLGKSLIDKLNPSSDIKTVQRMLDETSEGRRLLDASYVIPLEGIYDISVFLDKLQKGGVLEPEELTKVNDFLRGCIKVKLFIKDKEGYAKTLSLYGENITELQYIEKEINISINGSIVDSNASKELKRIRKQIAICEGKIKEKLEKFMKNPSNKEYIQEPFVSKRNGRYTVPIKAAFKNIVHGTIIETSSKGGTIFMEPECISRYTVELNSLIGEESIENSLSTFSSHVNNLSYILKQSNKNTLLLFDEIGSRTEPNEGAALAIAVLEEFYHKGCITVATTHYGEIKNFSQNHSDFENAAMEFKKDTLEPLYKLTIGKSGNSNALYIAKKMGISEKILEKTKDYIKNKNYNYDVVDKSKVKVKKENINEEGIIYDYKQGDKVLLLDKDESALVYEGIDEFNNITVMLNKELIKVNYKRIKLLFKAEELYPEGYDLNQLFVSFKRRKFERDIERGSKKALKKLRKEKDIIFEE